MAKTLYLHVGHFKTGTTALQVFFARNSSLFASLGIDYATTNLHNAKQSAYAFVLLQAVGVKTLMHGFTSPLTPEEMWEGLFDYVRASKSPSVLVSSEEFMRLGAFPEAAARLRSIVDTYGAGVEIKVIAYLRSPQAHLKSWYNQLVKMGRVMPDFTSSLQGEIESIHIDYQQAIAPWVELFGQSNVILRHYAPLRDDPGSLFRDFLSIFGLEVPGGLEFPKGDPNPRLDDRLLNLVRLMQNSGIRSKGIEILRQDAGQYLEGLDAKAPRAAADLAAVRARASNGIAALVGFEHSNLDLASLAADLPMGDPTDRMVDTDVIAFVFSELLAIRRRINRAELDTFVEKLGKLEARLKALE